MPNLLQRRITFGGDIVPALIASAPNIIRAERKMTIVQVAGSNREIVDMEDAWECYDQPYTVFLGDGSLDSIQEPLNNVARVLYKNGWQELIDDYEPDIYRLAYYKGPFDVENRKTRVGKFNITFRCRPERYLIIGSTEVSVPSGSVLTNPTSFEAKPLIHITGSGNGTLTIAGQVITIKNMVDYLNIDCDKMDVYRQVSENRNNCMEGNFPVLKAGNNGITFTDGISSVSIIPRWWQL